MGTKNKPLCKNISNTIILLAWVQVFKSFPIICSTLTLFFFFTPIGLTCSPKRSWSPNSHINFVQHTILLLSVSLTTQESGPITNLRMHHLSIYLSQHEPAEKGNPSKLFLVQNGIFRPKQRLSSEGIRMKIKAWSWSKYINYKVKCVQPMIWNFFHLSTC